MVVWSDVGAPFQLVVSGPWSLQVQNVFVTILNHKQWEGQKCSDLKGQEYIRVAVLLLFRSICNGSSSSVISWFQNIFVLITESSFCWCLVHICQHVDILSFSNMAVRSCLIIFLMLPAGVSVSFQNCHSFLFTLIWEFHSSLFPLVCKSSYKSRDERICPYRSTVYVSLCQSL
jgi:hypothetical protein